MAYEVRQLLSNLGPAVVAKPEEPLKAAVERMVQHGFSQLPVVKQVEGKRRYYFVTDGAVLRALYSFGGDLNTTGLLVNSALEDVKRVYLEDDDLFDLLGGIRDYNAVLVVNGDGNLSHVVTSYDVAQFFRQWAEDIMLVRDVEQSLKRLIQNTFRTEHGDIDEAALRTAIEGITSSNKKLRKKFDNALGDYLGRAASRGVALCADWERESFMRFYDGAEQAGPPAGDEIPPAETQPAGGLIVAAGTDPLTAGQALYQRFGNALRHYLQLQAEAEAKPDDQLAEQAFSYIYDARESVKPFGELTLDNYITLFLGTACWPACEGHCATLGLSADNVRRNLQDVRDIRNDLAHFREEMVTPLRRQQLKSCLNWLSDLEKLVSNSKTSVPEDPSDSGARPGAPPANAPELDVVREHASGS